MIQQTKIIHTQTHTHTHTHTNQTQTHVLTPQKHADRHRHAHILTRTHTDTHRHTHRLTRTQAHTYPQVPQRNTHKQTFIQDHKPYLSPETAGEVEGLGEQNYNFVQQKSLNIKHSKASGVRTET